MAEETRVIYHLEDQETPYLIRIGVPAQRVTLADFKHALNKTHVRFFFKSVDEDCGVVKEEISDEDATLPSVNGRVVCWVVSCDSCQSDFKGSDLLSLATPTTVAPPPMERTGGMGESRPPSFHAAVSQDVQTAGLQAERGERDQRLNGHAHHPSSAGEGAEPPGVSDSSSAQRSSQLEVSSLGSSEEDSGGRLSQSTEHSGSSPRLIRRQRRRHRKPKTQQMEKSVSFSSVTDSTMSLNIVTVSLNMERFDFLGISIVGQSNERGDGGVYVGSIMKGGAVAADGRIEPGDMLLQVNDVNFENMSNDDAVQVLREIVHKPSSPVTLTVAKCWDPNPQGCFRLPRSEPVRPIDPAAWVSHTAAMTGRLLPHYGVHAESQLTIHSDMMLVAKAMSNPESGVEVRDRMWLKITIPNAFIGSDVVDWLHRNVEGFSDRREARKYAGNLLKDGLIRHTINKVTFSEQCYYVFGHLCVDPDRVSSPGSDCDAPGLPDPGPYSSSWGVGGGAARSPQSEESCSSGSHCHDVQRDAGGRGAAAAAGGSGGGASGGRHQDVSASPDLHQVAAESLPSALSGLHGNTGLPQHGPCVWPSETPVMSL